MRLIKLPIDNINVNGQYTVESRFVAGHNERGQLTKNVMGRSTQERFTITATGQQIPRSGGNQDQLTQVHPEDRS